MEFNVSNIFCCGDIHGDLNFFSRQIQLLPENSILVQIGDFGTGFIGRSIFERFVYEWQTELAAKNCFVFVLRGNHDMEETHFEGQYLLPNIQFLPDYSVIKINDKNCLFVGGAISVDRKVRRQGVSYWDTEPFIYDCEAVENIKKEYGEIFGIFTHSAPSYCDPVQFHGIVLDYAKIDPTLTQELLAERKEIDKLFDFKPKLHVYGHFHHSNLERINDCDHHLLGINEMKDLTKYFNE